VNFISERSGTEFDPELVALFLANMDRVEEILIEYGDDGLDDAGESALS